METQILSGKQIAEQLIDRLKDEVEDLKLKTGKIPTLSVISIGEDFSSKTYIKNKEKVSKKVGINFHHKNLPKEIKEEELIKEITLLNEDINVNGVIVQFPLPKHISTELVINTISPIKDVDGYHPLNLGKLLLGSPTFIPCTPQACLTLLKSTGLDITGKRVTVIGRSIIVGKPLSLLLLSENATVTICHSKTVALESITKESDILIVAIGKAKFLKGEWIKEGSVIIDVGINQFEGKIVGDTDFESCLGKASWITPVPGGVGPLTVYFLIHNTIKAFKLQNNLKLI